eukprot:3119479-Pyramimonas_sp.AAC.1
MTWLSSASWGLDALGDAVAREAEARKVRKLESSERSSQNGCGREQGTSSFRWVHPRKRACFA